MHISINAGHTPMNIHINICLLIHVFICTSIEITWYIDIYIYICIHIYIHSICSFSLYIRPTAQILKCAMSPSRDFDDSFAHFFVTPRNAPSPVDALRFAEKRRLRKVFFRQRTPRCTRLPLQRASFAKLELTEMDYNAVRSFEGSRWTIMHLGEV